MQTCRTIALAEFQYANDNGGRYPDGSSSTEVFQKLIDGKYVDDPAIFYVPMPGKKRPEPGQRLKPENVSYDVTGGVDSSAPDHLPLVFLTGFKVDYRPGGQAVSLSVPHPSFHYRQRTWWEWINFQSSDDFGPAMAVAYHNTDAFVRLLDLPDHPLQTRTFVPQDFDPQGKTYRQLTPDGVLK